MTREIPLTRGQCALVDDADFETVVSAGKWQAAPGCNTFYARHAYRRDGKVRHVHMHTLLLMSLGVDHIDGNGLDNRRQNLRPATGSQNAMNRATPRDNTSGFKGVHRNRLRWQAQIKAGGRRISLGTFDTPEEAARAYDAAALHHFGAFARPNFPQEIGA